ncbi:MAG: hypothetical protein ACM3NQ_03410 [Bacteroidales bacterium]
MRATRFVTVLFLVLLIPAIADAQKRTHPANGIGNAVAAAQADPQGQCSVATLKGTYGNLEQGTVLMDVFGMTAPIPFAVAGVITYDGAGNLSGIFKSSFGGFILPGNATGTYTVNPDCTYSDYIPTTQIHRKGTITGEGMLQEIQTITTDAWLMATGTKRRTPVGGCSEAILKGTYSLFGQGLVPLQMPQILGAHTGLLTMDGKGMMHGEETVNLAGSVLPPATFTGAYSVAGNCTVSVEITSGDLILHEFGVIVGEGIHQEVRTVITDQGWVFVDSVKRQ